MMSDTEGPDKKEPRRREFMREKIVKPPLTRRQIAARAAVFLLAAAAFGAVSALSFTAVRSWSKDRWEDSSRGESTAIEFNRDDPEAQPEESGDETDSAGEGVEPEYDPMPQSSLSQNEAPVDGADSDFLVGQPPIGYQVYEVPETMQTYDLDAAQADQLEALRGELYQNLAGRLLAALAKLPAEDAALLADNMSEEDYAAFLELVDP